MWHARTPKRQQNDIVDYTIHPLCPGFTRPIVLKKNFALKFYQQNMSYMLQKLYRWDFL
jgi:hypothetical protein